jgi:lipid-A-disaccharide synthase
MVVAYKVSWIEAQARHFINVPSIVLPNLILGENVVPEFLQERADPEALAAALARLISGGPERERQSLGFLRLGQMLRLEAGDTPSARAAAVVLSVVSKRHAAEKGIN